MTAIVVIVTADGFVIAADGRCRPKDDGTLTDEIRAHESDCETKIFHAKCGGRHIAYTVAGWVCNMEQTYDLRADLKRASNAASHKRFDSFEAYVRTLASIASETITDAAQGGLIEPVAPDQSHEFAGMFIASYFDGLNPSLGIVVFSRDGKFRIEIHSPPRHNRFLGSDKILRLIDTGEDERMMRYFHPLERATSLEEATDLAQTYIRACSDPIAAEIDSGCKTIGGHIHIATITPSSGFQWVPGYEPIAAT